METPAEIQKLLTQGQLPALEELLQNSAGVEKTLEEIFRVEATMPSGFREIMLGFVEGLRQDRWIVSACEAMLKQSGRWDAWVVALVLRKVMQRAVGQTLMAAEIVWARELSFMARAVACCSPVTISSAIDDNVLYVAGSSYDFDTKNRSPFCWKGTWAYDNKKEFWRLIPAQTGTSSDFYLVSVYTEGYLYASTFPVTSDADGFAMKRVLVKSGESPPNSGKEVPDAAGLWHLQSLGGETYSFYNASHDAFLSSPREAGDGSRRDVATAPYRPLDDKRSISREWRINAAPSTLEMALQRFFTRKYTEAVELFSEVLTKAQLSIADRKKVLCYRMAANLMLKNDGCFQQDLALVADLGGYPDYFFDTLASRLSDTEQKMLERRQHLDLDHKRMEEDEGEDEEDGEVSVKRRKKDHGEEENEGYSFFISVMWQLVRDENPSLHVPGVAMKLAEMWRALPDKDRAKYKKMQEEAEGK